MSTPAMHLYSPATSAERGTMESVQNAEQVIAAVVAWVGLRRGILGLTRRSHVTAKALALAIPRSRLLHADEVIQ